MGEFGGKFPINDELMGRWELGAYTKYFGSVN